MNRSNILKIRNFLKVSLKVSKEKIRKDITNTSMTVLYHSNQEAVTFAINELISKLACYDTNHKIKITRLSLKNIIDHVGRDATEQFNLTARFRYNMEKEMLRIIERSDHAQIIES